MPSLNSHSAPGVPSIAAAGQPADAAGCAVDGTQPAAGECGSASPGMRKNVAAGARAVYWRSLEEFADSPEFREVVEREFPTSASELVTPDDRRDFIKVMGASFALAGLALTGCRRWPERNLKPFANRPENRVPGVPVHYATCMEVGGFAQGLLATSVDGRPIKLEGNPDHPLNAGATDLLAQASVLELYDIDRSRTLMRGDAESSWSEFVAFAKSKLGTYRAAQGQGLAIIAEPTSSPTAARLAATMAKAMPKATYVEWEPTGLDNEREGTAMAFGAPHRVQRTFSGPSGTAKVVLSLDADFLLNQPESIRYAREFARTRRATGAEAPNVELSRLYMLDSGACITGVMADERIAMRAMDVGPIAAAIARACGVADPAIGALADSLSASKALDAHGREVVELCAKDLLANKGSSLVVAGAHQPPEVHAIAAMLNELLGNVGKTVTYTPEPARPTRMAAIAALAKAIGGGEVSTLVVLGCNPVYDAPADLDFAGLLKKVPTSIHHGYYRDETARRCTWHLPRPHYLECWSDARSYQGTYSVAQPLIAPMIDPGDGGRSHIEFLDDLFAWCGGEERAAEGQALVRETFGSMAGVASADADAKWRAILHDGFLKGSSTAPASVKARAAEVAAAAGALASRLASVGPESMEVVFRPDAKVRDGRYSNNAWLQELPEPVTKLTWDNAAVISLGTAAALGVSRGDLISVEVGGRSLEIAALPLPGHADHTVSIALGYGRNGEAGRIADGAGFNGYAIRSSAAPCIAAAKATKSSGHYPLVSTQDRGANNAVADAGIQERLPTLVRETTLSHFKEHPNFAKHPTPEYHVPHRLSLWEESNLAGAKHRWAMSVDLSTCTGCNACVVACQAENNIPVVGKEQVRRGREMSWIRIDRYFRGDNPAKPDKTLFQPVTCMQCENAPCEQVCPVAATVHDEDGLNTMVYNRCVGTRYCSNNCPYKVRRFNYFDWNRMDPKRSSDWIQPQSDYYVREPADEWKRMQFNPDVTIRMRGVMEKCTFCTQRIARAKIDAKNAWAKKGGRQSGVSDYTIPDGMITPACAQSCPAQAIVFGDLNDPMSRVSKLFKSSLSYEMLEELNTKPRVRYLAKLSNPAHDHGHGHDHGHDHDHDHDHGPGGAHSAKPGQPAGNGVQA